MTNRLTGFYFILTLMTLTSLTYAQIGSLNKIDSNHLAMAETGTETPEERAHEENPNVQNGFSPAGTHPNMTQGANNSAISNSLGSQKYNSKWRSCFWKSVSTSYNNRIRRFSMSFLWQIRKTN